VTDERALEAVRLSRAGMSVRQIARELGSGKSTVQRWLAAAPVPEEPPPAPPVPSPTDTSAMVDAVTAAAELVHGRALADHDPAVAGRAVVDLASATAIGARVDKLEVQPGMWMTPAEIRDGMARIYQRVQDAVAEQGPVHCPGCGCELQVAPMGEDLPAVDEAPREPSQANPALARARETYEYATATVDSALADGNIKAAQRANRARTDATRVYARVEREERQRKAEGQVFFPDGETAKSLDDLRARMAILATVPLMCGPCLAQSRMRQTIGVVSAPG
jgi:hypothetical protein